MVRLFAASKTEEIARTKTVKKGPKSDGFIRDVVKFLSMGWVEVSRIPARKTLTAYRDLLGLR